MRHAWALVFLIAGLTAVACRAQEEIIEAPMAATPPPQSATPPASTAKRRPEPSPQPTPTLTAFNTREKRTGTITTSLGRQVDVTVSGFDDSPMRFDQLVEVINEIEEIIGTPYPDPAVTMTLGGVVPGGFCGHNDSKYAQEHPGHYHIIERAHIAVEIDSECTDTLATIAHETAHTWFHGNGTTNWIEEGLANAIERQIIAKREGFRYLPVTYCESHRNIRELEQSDPTPVFHKKHEGFGCNYSLGDGIFGALMEHYGAEEFNERIRSLARKHGNVSPRELTIDDVRRALGDEGKASEIIETWYSGQPETRKWRHLGIVEWTHIPTTDGEWLHFAGEVSGEEGVHDFIRGKDLSHLQFLLHSGTGGTEQVDSIEDSLPVRWKRHGDTKAFIANYRMDQDTGKFQATAKILDDRLTDGNDLSLIVRNRMGAGPDGSRRESVSYSQESVRRGEIPDEFKNVEHPHADAIRWTKTPTLIGSRLTFAGEAAPGAVSLEHIKGECSQIRIYSYDDGTGWEWITSVSPYLTNGGKWKAAKSEITDYRTPENGTFEATAKVKGGSLPEGTSIFLVVTEENVIDRTTWLCSTPDVLSVAEIRR